MAPKKNDPNMKDLRTFFGGGGSQKTEVCALTVNRRRVRHSMSMQYLFACLEWEGSVFRETHRADECRFLTDEVGNEALSLEMQVEGTTLETGAASSDTEALDRFFNRIGASTARLSETEVVVG